MNNPTPYPDLNSVLREFVASVQSQLASTFVGAYLQGSFAVGDFDADSDVDFLIAIKNDLLPEQLAALQAMHARIFGLDTPWAQHLEGSYFPLAVLRRYNPASPPVWYLDNTSSVLVRSQHDDTQVVRWVARERGIALAGPPPATLIDPVPPDDLRREIRATMCEWADVLFANVERMNNRWYQPFVVLSYCRMLHSLRTGRVDSKLAGAEWAKEALDRRWAGLIGRAWQQRPNPSFQARQPADPADLAATLEFMRYALARDEAQGEQH